VREVSIEDELRERFGFSAFLPGQRRVVELLLAGQSAAAVFSTGGGKSLCYQLPARLLSGLTLVVSPLLSLMKDQLEFLRRNDVPAAGLDSTLDREQYNLTLERASTGALKILMVSVERFANERFRTSLKRMQVSLLVVDEAHCISEWGHNFRPEYLKIPLHRRTFSINQVLLLTATATPRVLEDMCERFAIPAQNAVVTGFYRPNLFLNVLPTPESQKAAALIGLIREDPTRPTIVYVTRQRTAERIAKLLAEFSARAYHAGMESEDRNQVQDRFMTGTIPIVVATIAFGMGIDKADIRRVIHYDLPRSIEGYSQEIGRAGRDGHEARCDVLANLDGIGVLESFIYGDTPERDAIRRLVLMIEQSPRGTLEVRMFQLCLDLNIRPLPLETLLVHLEMAGILEARYTYFEELPFKLLADREAIISGMEGERRELIRSILEHSRTARTWTRPDIQAITASYGTDRRRIGLALGYLDEKGWIELQPQRSVEVFGILRRDFDVEEQAESLHRIMKDREQYELDRIRQMVQFFESDMCLSRRLSEYFGQPDVETCGHCSVCSRGKVRLEATVDRPPLSVFRFREITSELFKAAGLELSRSMVTRFLCGISSPVAGRLRLSRLASFGVLEEYSYRAVAMWVDEQMDRMGSDPPPDGLPDK
jgi:ATP-dependent DNA helicase RecQ